MMRVAGAIVPRIAVKMVGGSGETVGGGGEKVMMDRRKPRVAGVITRAVSVRRIRHGGGEGEGERELGLGFGE